jgi:ribonuclease PH
MGGTLVHCTASVEPGVPGFKKGTGEGWVTAEYAMLPRATHERTRREVTSGKPSGRTQEIQRLIGRSLRAVCNLPAIGEKQIVVDCDVIQADGGTRTAAITGAWVALHDCFAWMQSRSIISVNPLRENVAAVSCGIHQGTPVLDLDYAEDSIAETDANFVMTGNGGLVEVQGTAEGKPFSEDEFMALLRLAKSGVAQLVVMQKAAVAA